MKQTFLKGRVPVLDLAKPVGRPTRLSLDSKNNLEINCTETMAMVILKPLLCFDSKSFVRFSKGV